MFIRYFISLLSIAFVVGCGGGNSSDQPSSPNQQSLILTGGNIGVPTLMQQSKVHEISTEPNFNYYRINVQTNQTIYLFSILENPIDPMAYNRCSLSPNQYYTGIKLVNSDITSCSNVFLHTFDYSGEAVFKIGFPDQNTGHFVYAVIGDEGDEQILEANGEGGTPDFPRRILTDGTNQISNIHLYNFFAYEGLEGETIELTSFLTDTHSNVDAARCSSSPSDVTNIRNYGFSVMENNEHYSCDKDFTYTFDRTKTVIIHAKFLRNAEGYFMFSSNR